MCLDDALQTVPSAESRITALAVLFPDLMELVLIDLVVLMDLGEYPL